MKHQEAALVGRRREVKELLAGVMLARGGYGSLCLITGEPGIGKTRLAEEVAALSRQHRALVTWSRCWNAPGAPAYRPWRQLIKGCLAGKEIDRSHREIQSALAEIDRLVPPPGRSLGPRHQHSPPDDPEEARFRLLDAVLTLLRAASERAPVVGVLDDLGSADLPSVLLLRNVARELHDSQVLLVATCRDSELRGSPLLADALLELSRDAQTIELRGLSRDEIVELAGANSHLTPEQGDALTRASGGNPFFAQSILKLGSPEKVLGAGRALGPGRIKFTLGLRGAIEGHLAPLTPPARMVLEIASVIGREFDANLLASAVGRPLEELLELLAQAEACGLIGRAFESGGWHYRFLHSLVADGLYEGIPAVERPHLHMQIGQKIEELYSDDLESRLGPLAHHYFEAARLGGFERARKYAERAAGRAEKLGAFEDAAGFYQMALAAIGVARRSDRRPRCELLLAMGEAQRRAGDYEAARDSFRGAAELAAQLGDGPLLAHAALGYPYLSPGVISPLPDEAIRLLDQALKALPKRDDPWRAMVMARLAAEVSGPSATSNRRRELVEAAMSMVRRTGDDAAILTVLEYRDLTLTGPDMLDERFSNADEMTRTAEKIGSQFGIYIGSRARVYCFRQTGEIARAQSEIEAMKLLERITRMSACMWSSRCFAAYRALMDGRFAEAQSLSREAWEFADRMRGAASQHIFWPAMMMPYRERNRLSEIEPLAVESLRQRPTSIAYRALLALINLHCGRAALARAEYEAIAAAGFAEIRHDGEFLATMVAVAELASTLGDSDGAAELLRILQPHSALHAVLGPIAGFGSVARYLGMLAAAAGSFNEAADHYEQALAANYRTDTRTFAAYTRADYAEMLLRRDSDGDRAQAAQLLAGLAEYAEAIGMSALAARADSLAKAVHFRPPVVACAAHPEPPFEHGEIAKATGSVFSARDIARSAAQRSASRVFHQDSPCTSVSDRALEMLVPPAERPGLTPETALTRDGDYWAIHYKGHHMRFKHLKGLACLAVLLAHPDLEVHSLNLATIAEQKLADPASAEIATGLAMSEGLGDAGPLLDARARAEYMRRISELRAEREDALQAGRLGEVSRAEEELTFLEAEIARAVGLGGRNRLAASAAERARISVTKSIKCALAKITQQNRDLGTYLAATIRTGTFCSYTPNQ